MGLMVMINIFMKKFLSLIILILSIIFLNTSMASETTSAKNIIENWDNDDSIKTYAIGVVDGIVSYSQIIDEFYPNNDSKFFCFPNNSPLTNQDHLNLIEADYIKNKFEYADLDFKIVATLTLIDIYPC